MIETTKQLPPDVGAAAFWLKNRMREKYRDRWPDNPAQQDESQTGLVLLPEVSEDE